MEKKVYKSPAEFAPIFLRQCEWQLDRYGEIISALPDGITEADVIKHIGWKPEDQMYRNLPFEEVKPAPKPLTPEEDLTEYKPPGENVLKIYREYISPLPYVGAPWGKGRVSRAFSTNGKNGYITIS